MIGLFSFFKKNCIEISIQRSAQLVSVHLICVYLCSHFPDRKRECYQNLGHPCYSWSLSIKGSYLTENLGFLSCASHLPPKHELIMREMEVGRERGRGRERRATERVERGWFALGEVLQIPGVEAGCLQSQKGRLGKSWCLVCQLYLKRICWRPKAEHSQ